MATKVLILLCVTLLSHCGSTSKRCSNYSPCQLKVREPLRHPTQLLSGKGRLETTLRVQMSKITVGGWLDLWRRTYNGQMGGPTWRVRPGDAISVKLVNTLGPNARDNSQNQLKLANSTNLFLHGLHISPRSNDARVRVDPGQKKQYLYKIDCSHPPGTYWYHPHVHGSTLFQTLSGMAGMIVVEDIPVEESNQQSISSYSCPKHCDHEVHLLFQPAMLYKIKPDGFSFLRVQKRMLDGDMFRNREKLAAGGTLAEWLISRENDVEYYTTNGQIQPKIRLQAGKTMRFRMVNAGGLHVLEVGVSSSENGDSCEIHEIARDGVYLSQPQKPRHGVSILPQGGTLDWLIRCDHAGSFNIESNPDARENSGLGRAVRFRGLLANMEVVGTPKQYLKASFPAKFEDDGLLALPEPPTFMPSLLGTAQHRVTGKFVVEACTNNILNRQKYSGPNSQPRHQMPLDGVQEWSLLNTDPINSHTLHLQGNFFQVVSYNQYNGPVSVTTAEGTFMLDQTGRFCNNSSGMSRRSTGLPSAMSLKKAGIRRNKYIPYSSEGYAPPGQWRNVIIVSPLSNITIRLLPRHFTEKVLLHSQNLLRDDFGMKMLIEIVEKGQSIENNIVDTEEGLPGTCGADDFYPVLTSSNISLGKTAFESFFTWLYDLKPAYKAKYGDQRYLSGIYTVYLDRLGKTVTNGDHMRDFFEWAYVMFPGYREFYGNQGYLTELYNFYIAKKVKPGF